MNLKDFNARAEKISLWDRMELRSIDQIIELKLYENLPANFTAADCQKAVAGVQTRVVRVRRKNSFSFSGPVALIVIAILIVVSLIVFVPGARDILPGRSASASSSNECGRPNSNWLKFSDQQVSSTGNTAFLPESVPALTEGLSYLCFADADIQKVYDQKDIRTEKGTTDGRSAIASQITKVTGKGLGKIGNNGEVKDQAWVTDIYNRVYAALDPGLFLDMSEPGSSYVVLPGLKAPAQAAGAQATPKVAPPVGRPSDSGKPVIPEAAPVIPTSTQSFVPANNQTAYDKYVVIAGEESAKVAFTADQSSQCSATFVANWEDFTESTPLTEVLRLLGPAGYNVQPNGDSILFRTQDKDTSGFSGCVVTSNVVTDYPQGSWRISTQGEIPSLHWYPMGSGNEVQVGNVFIAPVFNPQAPTAVPTRPSNPVLDINSLGNWMRTMQYSELVSPGCPSEPLRGQLNLTTVGGSTYVAVVDFGGDTFAALKYSQYECSRTGGLHFNASDPGQAGQVQYPGPLYVWPMAKPQVLGPTATPGGLTYPADGSKVSLTDLLRYMDSIGQTSGFATCTNTTNGSIPGWPSAVSVKMNVVTYLVDFGSIASRIDTTTLCKYGSRNGQFVPAQGINFAKSPSGNSNWGPWLSWGGWYFSPFK